MKLIDFHTHAFPERIAARAVSKLAHASGGWSPRPTVPWTPCAAK